MLIIGTLPLINYSNHEGKRVGSGYSYVRKIRTRICIIGSLLDALEPNCDEGGAKDLFESVDFFRSERIR